MIEHSERNRVIKQLGELIRGIKVAMLTTVESDGTLRSRPMAAQQAAFDGDLWFFTDAGAAKVDEVQRHHQVNLSYIHTEQDRYVSVSGLAELVRDRKKMEELWDPSYKAWFPKGVDQPGLALIRVNVQKAEYWDSLSSSGAQLIGFTKGPAAKEGEGSKRREASSKKQEASSKKQETTKSQKGNLSE